LRPREGRFRPVPLVVPCESGVPTTVVRAIMTQKKLKNWSITYFEPIFFPKVA